MSTMNLDAKTDSEVRGSTARPSRPSVQTRIKNRQSAASAAKPSTPPVETEIRSRLGRSLGKVADTLEARGDEEMASVIREDGDAMAQGLVSLTRSVTPLRGPLLLLLAFLEPVLAFGRVFRLAAGRWADRRARRADRRAETDTAEQVG